MVERVDSPFLSFCFSFLSICTTFSDKASNNELKFLWDLCICLQIPAWEPGVGLLSRLRAGALKARSLRTICS